MLMVITSALVETLVKHMFNNYLDERDKVEMDGAPSWYMEPVDDKLCSFSHKTGTMDNIDIVKSNARFKIIRKIDKTIEIIIYDNMKNIKNEREKKLIRRFKEDKELPLFVDKYLHYPKIKYEEEIKTTFVKACISKDSIIDYQKERLVIIKKEVLNSKVNDAFAELEAELK
ncbi:MAG: hypothetical protein U9Q30_02190 [Campylobacterota bacterium]|nr:hypothetical protein [Campylobacterota bacterium]